MSSVYYEYNNDFVLNYLSRKIIIKLCVNGKNKMLFYFMTLVSAFRIPFCFFSVLKEKLS